MSIWNDHPQQPDGIVIQMRPCISNTATSGRPLALAARVTLVVIAVVLTTSSLADTNSVNSSRISISSSNQRYSVTATQATLSELLQKLGDNAGFKLKIFEKPEDVPRDWNFHSMALPRILDNLLRGYSTVMLYEESDQPDDRSDSDDEQVLKELWLLAQTEDVEPDRGSTVNIEIQLDKNDLETVRQQDLTPEQQYEIAYIDNLEGMTGDDVIDILANTLLTADDPLVRKRAVTALGEIGGIRVLDALESGMGDRSAEVRTELANSLSGIHDQRSMLLLGQLLMGDRNSRVREQAVYALHQQNTPAARSFVEAGLKDKDDGVSKAAEILLQQWPPRDN